MDRVFIIIPTYWGRPTGESSSAEDALFDHPTPVDGESTLPRLLDSLCDLETEYAYTILIITAVVTDTLVALARLKVDEIIKAFENQLDLIQICADDLEPYKTTAQKTGIDPTYINLSTYAGVRNLQLIVPHAMGADVIVALDDDEVVKPEYLDIALQSIEQNRSGCAGFYENAQGSIFIGEPKASGNIFFDKPFIMNDAARNLIHKEGRFVKSTVAFGGNMVFHQKLFSNVGFDPGITRGEDLDYVMNARLAGFEFWLDKQLRITHLPPHHYDSSKYAKMAEDVRRFVYEREKLRVAKDIGIDLPSMDTWMPYPGRFFQDDLEEQALKALEALVTPTDAALWSVPNTVLENVLSRAQNMALEYFKFARHWPRMMHNLQTNS